MAVKTWDGSSSSNWALDGNWIPFSAPLSGDDVIIPDDATTPNDCQMTINSPDLGNFTIQTGGSLDVNGQILTVSGNFNIATSSLINTGGGTIKFDGTTVITSNGNDLDNIEITNGSTLTLQGDLTVNDILNNGTVDCNGFVLTITGTPTGTGSYVGCGGSVAPYSESRKRTTRLPIILGG